MKIFTADQIRTADTYTIEHEPIASIELMERAASRLTAALAKEIPTEKAIKVFCGIGNNGGDGLACARLLSQRGFTVDVFVVRFSDKTSADFATNLQWLNQAGIQYTDITSLADIPPLTTDSCVIDGIFGSGLSRPPEAISAGVIESVNRSQATTYSIDMPSGLFADKPSGQTVIEADYTFTFQLPKLAFMLPENAPYVGEWEVIDIGLHPAHYAATEVINFFTTQAYARELYNVRGRFSHKGTFGHALMVTGSKGMMGAAVLASKAALRAGAGLVTAYVPQVGYEIMQEAVPEAMALTSESRDALSELPDVTKFDAIGIGPGIGTLQPTRKMLSLLLNHWTKPLVIDADALNIIALEDWLSRLPPDSLLTPHPGEFKRLAGDSADGFDMLEKQRQLSQKYNIVVVLKRAYTCITFPDGTAHFNSSGSPALATAGSGDVLTGVITGLLAQGYSPQDASRLGVWLHGSAGQIASKRSSDEAVIAGDVIANLGAAFKVLQ